MKEIEGLIPQRYPFLMIDRVVEVKSGEYIKAYKNISIGEEYFKGHFPGSAIFPGALTAEAMAQTACVLAVKSMEGLSATQFYITAMKIRFLKIVVPGDRLCITAKAIKMASLGGIFETEATVGDDIVAKGEMTLACR